MKKLFLFATVGLLLLCSFVYRSNDEQIPRTITRTVKVENGNTIHQTIILLDGSTSRDELISTCKFLATEDVQLTFSKLEIGRSSFGMFGKNRITTAEGNIKLANGQSQSFKAGGALSFKSVRIQYSNTIETKSSQIDMIEIVD